MKETSNSASAYAAATQILLDCTCPGPSSEVDMRDGTKRNVCFECWNRHVDARRAARKLQLAEHKAKLPACEGGHVKNTPARWNLAGVHLCGRCKTKAQRQLHRNATGAGNFSYLHMFSPMTRERVLGALTGGAQ